MIGFLPLYDAFTCLRKTVVEGSVFESLQPITTIGTWLCDGNVPASDVDHRISRGFASTSNVGHNAVLRHSSLCFGNTPILC